MAYFGTITNDDGTRDDIFLRLDDLAEIANVKVNGYRK
jgi:hypothetical protein